MVVSPSLDPAVVWHELECGGYRADLELWRELAAEAEQQAPGLPLLDVGAGSGRVTLDLARRGHHVTAVDLDPILLATLRSRAAGLPVQTVCADMRELALERSDHQLCLVPMQTVQLLSGPTQRAAFLRGARRHMRSGGLLAMAIVTQIEPYDCRGGDLGPPPDRTERGELLFESRAVRVGYEDDTIAIERDREIRAPSHAPERERDLIHLAAVSADELAHEGERAGFAAAPKRVVSETFEHAGSEVVMLRA